MKLLYKDYVVKEDADIPIEIKKSIVKQVECMLSNPKKYYRGSYFTAYYYNWRIRIYKRTGTIGAWVGLTIEENDEFKYDNYHIMFKVYENEGYVRWLLDDSFKSLPKGLIFYLKNVFFNDKVSYTKKNRGV